MFVLNIYFIKVTNLSQYTVRLWIELEARFDSIKRIKEYVDVSFFLFLFLYSLCVRNISIFLKNMNLF